MPLIDPSLQCFLVQNIEEAEEKDGYAFFLKYLKIASNNISRNSTTIEASRQFKKDFVESISTINEEFGLNFKNCFGPSFNRNCYKYFYRHIKFQNKDEESRKFRGRYRICDDKFNTRFFEPFVFYSKYHSWFFTDTPIAILSINSELFTPIGDKKEILQHILQLIKLEVDLISASGLTLVLCFNYAPILNDFITKIIHDDQFSEIHSNIFNESNIKPFITNLKNKSDFLRGYLYVYTQFAPKNTEERTSMKEFKKFHHTKVVTFCTSPDKSLQKHKFHFTKPFMHCKTGFDSRYLRVFLNYVPLYETDDNDAFIPSSITNVSLGYIDPVDFLNGIGSRVEILIDDLSDRHQHKFKYVNFDDIHLVRSDFFVKDSLSLAKIDVREIRQINKIRNSVNKKIENEQEFKRNRLYDLLKIGKYDECLKYVTYAYTHFIRSSIPDFVIHRTQIYAALEACKTCFKEINDEKDPETKGVIYQVDTGEGKSCILCLIAAVLALKKYTVHIASSNINLSNRDYFNSYEFFKMLGIKSAVLLHKNELPFRATKANGKNEGEDDEENDEEKKIKRLPLKDLSRYQSDSIFKSNADYYFEVNTQKNDEIYRKKYPTDFFGPDLFKNPSHMNFSVCGLDKDNNITSSKHKANVIFSTFVNFECFYLHLMEMCPGYIDKYFKQCSLLVDEADSFLIDEITNGMIVSREMKSNAKEVLTYVYNRKMNKKSAKSTYEELKKDPMCSDITLADVKNMYKEIKTVNKKEFKDGAKYSIETFEVRNNHRIRNFIHKTIRSIVKFDDTFADFIDKNIIKNKNDDDEGEEEDDDEEFDTSKVKKFKQIIPFDYNHKGILEPNKEFGGFIQQFISIKESMTEKNKDVVFKDISMSYLYVSHPIFANLYPRICGFTGTIGNSDDKPVYQKYYHLNTKKVPRHKANLRVDFPTIVCNNISERNSKIIEEVIEFHKREIPILVIFQELSEIKEFQVLLYKHGIEYINIFDGKEEYVSPDRIAGMKGAVSLGTNVCGRGTDIHYRGKPLHVIVSFYSSNVRVMNQAFGRTARQGRAGTCRCICLKYQYFGSILSKYSSLSSYSKIDQMKATVSEFEFKITAQQNFIEYYKSTRSWIFDFNIGKQSIPHEYIIEMRRARINVNRIVSYKYKFPICMSVETFLEIQSQKIFSLFNCPNSKYTWRLFQRHIREMILESWSIMIHKFEQEMNQEKKKIKKMKNKEKKKEKTEMKESNKKSESKNTKECNKKSESKNTKECNKKSENKNTKECNKKSEDKNSNDGNDILTPEYKKKLKTKVNDLIKQLEVYLPKDKPDIVDTFMHIHRKVVFKYQNDVINSFKKLSKVYLPFGESYFTFFQLGFRPYSLLSKSGSRISYSSIDDTNFIEDPELKYIRKMPDNKFSFVSITERIDMIFNAIFQKVSSTLGEKVFLKFFLRRTLAGCEFGLCFDINMSNSDEELSKEHKFCLIDKDPLLVFTIFLWSMIPVMAGVLVFVLVYITGLCKQIISWVDAFPAKITAEVLKQGVLAAINLIVPNSANYFLDKLLGYLEGILSKQLSKLSKFDNLIIDQLKNIFLSHDLEDQGESISEKLSSTLGGFIKIPAKLEEIFKKSVNIALLMKIGFLLLLCLGTYIRHFTCRNDAIDHVKEDANDFDSTYEIQENKQSDEFEESYLVDVKTPEDELKNLVEKEEKNEKEEMDQILVEIPKIDKEKADYFETEYYKVSGTDLYKFKTLNLSGYEVKPTSFKDHKDKDEISFYNVQSSTPNWTGQVEQEYLKLQFNKKDVNIIQSIRLYATSIHPAISRFYGYYAKGKSFFVYVEKKENGFLGNYIKNQSKDNSLNSTDILIIAYGLASALEFLHSKNIVHGTFRLENILLDSLFYPYLIDFGISQIRKGSDILSHENPLFMAPELGGSISKGSVSFASDVFAYAMVLLNLFIQKHSFYRFSEFQIYNAIQKGERPQIPDSIPQIPDLAFPKWKNLIEECWHQDPKKRPTFTEICDLLESDAFVDSFINIVLFNDYMKIIKPNRPSQENQNNKEK